MVQEIPDKTQSTKPQENVVESNSEVLENSHVDTQPSVVPSSLEQDKSE